MLMMFVVTAASAKGENWFRPRVSLLTGYTMTENNKTIYSGTFDIHSRKVGFGLSLTNKFYLKGDYFLNTGLRYYNYQSVIEGLNPLPDRFDKPAPLKWAKGYESVAIPVQLGKDFSLFGKQTGAFFIGLSAGVLMSSFDKGELTSDLAKNVYNLQEIESEMSGDSELPNSFYLTGDVGVDFQPFKPIPNLSIGLLCSVQLNRTSFQNSFRGTISNHSTNEKYPFKMDLRQQFSSFNVVIGYTFKNHKHIKSVDPLNCPE